MEFTALATNRASYSEHVFTVRVDKIHEEFFELLLLPNLLLIIRVARAFSLKY